MEPWQVVLTIMSTIFGSSAAFGFIQYMLDRKDRKHTHIKEIETSISDLDAKLEGSISNLNFKIDGLSQQIDLRSAVDARTRILQASDEIRRGVEHSQESFDQLHEDITLYNNYCSAHEKFENNKAVNAIANINNAYQKRLEKNDFL